MFSNFLNKSFKAVYNTFSTATPRPQITFLKLTSLLYKPSLELPSIFLIYNNVLHIYHFQNLPTVNFNLFCKYPLSTPTTSVHPVNHIPSFISSLPVIATLPTNQNVIHFITLNTKSLLKTIELPSSVLSISFNRKYFGVACSNSKILIYDNNSLSEKEVLPIYAISKDKISKITSQAHFTRLMFGSNSNNNNNSSSSNSRNIIFDMSDNFIMYYISHPNTTANAVEQQNPHENPLYNSTSNITNESQYNTFEKIASNTYQSIKDFTSWGVQSIKNYNSLLQSKNISIPNTSTSTSTSIYVNTTNFKNATVINIFNISHAYTTHPNHNNSSNTTSSQIDVFALPYQIRIPSFKEGINSIKQIQNGKYIIIGNAHNQLFYIFELYPQTNKKYNINYIHNTSNRYKAIYSLFRGVTKCELNCLDISINNEYALITSKKGTHHVYHLPKRDNQINENVNGVSCSYTNDDLLNLKIVEANEIAKYKYDYYKNNNDKCNSLYDSMFINVDKITIEDNFNQSNSTKVMDIAKDKFSPYIHYGNYLLMVTDDKVNVVLIVNKNIIIPLNTFTINLDESEENIRRNWSIIMKQCSPIMNNNNTCDDDDIHLGQTCTDLSNFPVFQLNPLFTFNKAVDVGSKSTTTTTASTMNNVLLHVQNVFQFEFTTDNGFNVYYCSSNNNNNNNNNSELHLLNELCNKQHDIYTKIKSKRKLSDNYNDSIHSKSIIINPNYQDNLSSSCELKETFYENKASILQSNITQAINSSIHDKLKQTNEVTIQSEFEIHDNYY